MELPQAVYSLHKPHYPFDLPRGWVWASIAEVCDTCLGKMLDKQKNKGQLQPYLRNVNVRWGNFDLSDLLQMPFENEEEERYSICRNDLVVCEGGEPGRCAIWKASKSIKFQKALHRVRCYDGVLNKYLQIILNAFCANGMIEKYYTGSTIKHLTGNSLNSILFPLPPIKEQIRIVNEVERLEIIMETLAVEREELSAAIIQTKSRIIELAISGKLVPQDPADEPAEELLRRINPSTVPADKSHYIIPENWTWVKGKDIFLPMKSTKPNGITFKYIDIDSIDNVNQCISSVKILPTDKAPSRASRFTEKGNVLFSMVRPYLRNIAMVTESDCIASTGFYVCRQRVCLDSRYCYYLMTSQYVVDGLNQFMKGDNSPSINKGHIDDFLFPLPPLNEQKRIVTKVDELFAVIDHIQQSLEA